MRNTYDTGHFLSRREEQIQFNNELNIEGRSYNAAETLSALALQRN